MSRATGTGRPSWPLALAGVLLVVAGGFSWHAQQGGRGPAGPAGLPTDGPSATAPGSPAGDGSRPDARRAATPAAARPGVPSALALPSLGVRARVVPIGADRGVLVPPSDPTLLGWWAAGARPGDRQGAALLTGHTVHTGGGALDHLADLRSGERVRVTVPGGELGYVVRSVRTFEKGALADRAARVFGRRGPGRLVLVTCADWDGERYLSNVVVVARPA